MFIFLEAIVPACFLRIQSHNILQIVCAVKDHRGRRVSILEKFNLDISNNI
jgi:hypothetical protein